MPKISVVMPVYNVEKFLEQCLDSVINQTFKDIEIICVNDGSKDRSEEILNRYAESDSRIKVVNQANAGAAIARNKGIELASGEYLYIMDSDDFIELNMLETMYNKALETDSEVVVCDAHSFDNVRNEIIRNDYTLFKQFLPEKKCFNAKEYPKYIFNYTAGYFWNKLFKTSLIKDNNLFFPPEVKIFHDAFLTFTSLVLAKKQTYITDKFAYYRVNLTTNETSRLSKNVDDPLKVIYLIRKKLEQMGCYELYEQSLINVTMFWISNIIHMLTPNALKEFHKVLKTTFFVDFKILERDKDYFYDKSYYNLVRFINNPIYVFINNIKRLKILFKI